MFVNYKRVILSSITVGRTTPSLLVLRVFYNSPALFNFYNFYFSTVGECRALSSCISVTAIKVNVKAEIVIVSLQNGTNSYI